MQSQNHNRSVTKTNRGFTLLELLAVVSVLAVIAGGVIFNLTGTQINTIEKISRGEIATIASAIEAFKRDTGYFPKDGPFDLTTNGGTIDPDDADHWPDFLSSASASERTDWFNHPANFYQLTFRTSPLESTGHKLAEMQISSGRGWNGPYIKDAGEFVSAGTFNPVTHSHTPKTWTDETWDPTSGTIFEKIPAVFDPNDQTVGTFAVELTNGATPN